jgi:hypothetical protein
LADKFPSRSIVTIQEDPSFSALPCQTPFASLRRPETFEYPSASIFAFAASTVKIWAAVGVPLMDDDGGDEGWE